MPTVTPDQGITLPVDADVADAPVAFTNQTSGLESRLVLRYTNEADRTARHPVGIEGEVSFLASENRYEGFDSTNWISLHTRSLYASVRKTADQTVNNSAVLVNDTALLIALPIAGTFRWRTVVFHDSSTTGDIKFAHTIPAGAVMRWGMHGLASGAAGTSADGQFAATTVSGTALVGGGAGAGTTVMSTLEGEVVMGGTAGNLTLQWAQNTADPSDAIVRSRSYMQVWRVL